MLIIDLDQNSDAWLQWRKTGWGASDAPLLWFGSHFERTFDDLMREKRGLQERPTRQSSSYVMQKGKEFEVEARAWYEDLYEVEARPLCCAHDTHPFLLSSLDGYIPASRTILEIKWANRDDHALALGGTVTPKYEPQLWHQALVTDSPLIHYLSGSGNKCFDQKDWKVIVPYTPPLDKVAELLRRLLKAQDAITRNKPLTFTELCK